MRFESNKYALDISRKPISKGVVVDIDDIKQSIETILMTGRYERVFEPAFGFNLDGIIFERLEASSAESLLTNITKHVGMYENRVKVLSNACRMNINNIAHSIDIKLVFIVIATGNVEEFNKRILF